MTYFPLIYWKGACIIPYSPRTHPPLHFSKLMVFLSLDILLIKEKCVCVYISSISPIKSLKHQVF